MEDTGRKYEIVVIGDTVLDKYVYDRPKGNGMERGSGNTPIAQHDIVHIDKKLGGAYNVAHLLQNRVLNVNVTFRTLLPEEVHGLVDKNMYNFECLPAMLNGRFSVKERHAHFETLHVNARYDYYRAAPSCSQNDVYEWIKGLNFGFADLVVISDYRKGLLTDKVVRHIIANSKQTLIDTKNPNLDVYVGANYIKLNLQEFTDAREFYGNDDDKLAEALAIHNVIVTRGSGDTLFITTDPEDRNIMEIKVPIKKIDQEHIVDAIGCGDAFVAGFSWGILQYPDSPIRAIDEGHFMANANLTKPGASW